MTMIVEAKMRSVMSFMMQDKTMDYWTECIEIAFEESGIAATKEQIENVAGCVEGAHENYGMAHGHDAIPNPVESRAQEELRELKAEQERQRQWEYSTKPCKECTTTGIVQDGWGRDVTCDNCGGKGRC